jgi:hypothetical protein
MGNNQSMSVEPADPRYDWCQTNGAVLIASCTAASPSQGVIAREKADDRAKGNLLGTVADVAAMYKYLTDTKRNVDKMFNDVLDVSADDVMNRIKLLFDRGLHSCLLYYSGHGKENEGDWCFQNASGEPEFITLKAILATWNSRAQRFAEQQLIIVADCCYSGRWVEQLKELAVMSPIVRVSMQASCGAHQICKESLEGGVFTIRWLRMHATTYTAHTGVPLKIASPDAGVYFFQPTCYPAAHWLAIAALSLQAENPTTGPCIGWMFPHGSTVAHGIIGIQGWIPSSTQ